MESERRWTEMFARPESEDLLERLADETLSEHHAGRTRPLKKDRFRRTLFETAKRAATAD